MGLPKKFSELTLSQFMQLHMLALDAELNQLDRNTKRLSILLNKSSDWVESLNNGVRTQMINDALLVTVPPNDIKLNDKIRVKGKVLYPTISLQDMSVAQLVDFYSLHKEAGEDKITSANKLLAVMFKPKAIFNEPTYNPNKHAKISELLLSAKAEDCLGLLFFYSRFWKRCEPIIVDYLQNSKKELEEIMTVIQTYKEFQDFLNTGGGSTTSTSAERLQA